MHQIIGEMNKKKYMRGEKVHTVCCVYMMCARVKSLIFVVFFCYHTKNKCIRNF